MDSMDPKEVKRVRPYTSACSFVTAISLMVALSALSLSVYQSIYYGDRISKLEEQQKVMRRLIISISQLAPDASKVHTGINKREASRQQAEDSLSKLSARSRGSQVTGGSTYVRWGRTTCANTSERIYPGFVVGSHYNHPGGASNYECLPLTPKYSNYNSGLQGSWVYGAKYQTGFTNFPQTMQNRNVPCARCYVPSRSAKMMIPGRNSCPSSWTKEYDGYLMAGHYSHKRAYAFVCVDRNPEAIAGRHEDGAVFYFQETQCSSTGHCPPYVQVAELSCAVCTK